MNRFLELLIAIAIVVGIAVLVGLALPSHQSVTHDTETNRPLPVVFDMLSGFSRFKDWNSIHNNDPKAQITVQGSPASGKGARVDYASTNSAIGSGSWQIEDLTPGEKIVYRLDNGDYGSDKTMTFRFKRTGNQLLTVVITETYDVDYGWNLFGRFAGLYVSRTVGDSMKTSLASLNALLATVPKFDYTQLAVQPKVVDVPAENLLVASTAAKRENEAVEQAMQTEEKWLRQTIDKNGLEAAGPLRIVTTNYGADTFEFDVAIPVRKAGTGNSATNAEPPQLTGLVFEGAGNPVKYVRTQARRAITTTYSGHMAQLAAIREAMKAWGVTHGVDVADRPYAAYNKGVEAAFTDAGDFTLYWPVKVHGGN